MRDFAHVPAREANVERRLGPILSDQFGGLRPTFNGRRVFALDAVVRRDLPAVRQRDRADRVPRPRFLRVIGPPRLLLHFRFAFFQAAKSAVTTRISAGALGRPAATRAKTSWVISTGP